MDRARRWREKTWLNPRVFGSSLHPKPPEEQSVPSAGVAMLTLGFGSMPSVSLSVLTPTEMQRLQKDYYAMCNILLHRAISCPYPGRESIFAVNEKGRL
mgnify:CR=1 FL=1